MSRIVDRNDPSRVLDRMLSERGLDNLRAIVIVGSGMSDCFGPEELELVYREPSSVDGHVGGFAIHRRDGGAVLVGLGRKHLYEGYPVREVQLGVRAAARLGARTLIVTNAAGGLDPTFAVGDIMVVSDLLPSLIVGRQRAMEGSTASPLTQSLDRRPIILDVDRADDVMARATGAGLKLRRGCYAAVSGPSYETRAEIRMLRRMGAQAVGMSTLHEVAAGVEHGMSVVGFSLITNVLSDTYRIMLDHSDVVQQAAAARARMRRLIDLALESV